MFKIKSMKKIILSLLLISNFCFSQSTITPGKNGGTGIANTGKTITLATSINWPTDGIGFLKNNGSGTLTYGYPTLAQVMTSGSSVDATGIIFSNVGDKRIGVTSAILYDYSENPSLDWNGLALSGNWTGVTQSAGNNSTRLATTAYVFGNFAPISGGAYIPLTGTTNSSPVTGTIVYQGASGSTIIVDTIAGRVHYIGTGNRKDLSIATNYAYIKYDNSNVNRGVRMVSFQSSTGILSEVRSNYNQVFLSYTDGAANQTSTEFLGTSITTLSTYNLFPGEQYSAATCNYINSNADSTTKPHRGYIQRMINSSISSDVLTNGYIFVGNGSNIATGVLPALSASAGTFTVANTGVFTFPNATTSLRGLLTSTDWNTFNGKQSALSGTGFVYQSGSTTSYTTSIPNSALTNSTISGISLGSNLNSNTPAYGISGTAFNGSATISNWKVDTTLIASKLFTAATYAPNGSALTVETEQSSTPVSDNAEASIFTTQFYVHLTLPTTYKFYTITGIEWKNGTVVAGNVECGINYVDANPPVNATTVSACIGMPISQSGTSSVQRNSAISPNLILGGTTISAWINSSNVSGLFRYQSGLSSINRTKIISYVTAPPYTENTSWAAGTNSVYIKIYYKGIN